MAKRQVENTIFEETWFMDLNMEYKLLVLYFFITSNHAGLGNLNFKIINTILGFEYDKDKVLEILKEHLSEYKDGKYHLKKFMDFHYNEDNKSKVYQSAKKLLKNEGLLRNNDEYQSEQFDRYKRKGMVSKKFIDMINDGGEDG